MSKWHPAGRRMFGTKLRPRSVILILFIVAAGYYLLFSESGPRVQVVPYSLKQPAGGAASNGREQPKGEGQPEPQSPNPDAQAQKKPWEFTAQDLKDWTDPTDGEDPNDVEPGYETDGKDRGFGDLGKLQREKDMRKEWRHAYAATADLPSSNLIYAKTLGNLEHQNDRSEEHSKNLKSDPSAKVEYSTETPVRYNPYPDYNGADWDQAGYAPYIPCKGANDAYIEDLLVFKGKPRDWPAPRFGSYDLLNMDGNICWERETRLGPYGLTRQYKLAGEELQPLMWDTVNWGDLQRSCAYKNAQRFEITEARTNEYLTLYPETAFGPKLPAGAALAAREEAEAKREAEQDAEQDAEQEAEQEANDTAAISGGEAADQAQTDGAKSRVEVRSTTSGHVRESRTAVLLRSFTGKDYTENDKEIIRALVTELSLRSGGEYEVFLLVQVKEDGPHNLEDEETYKHILRQSIPPEFHSMTILWDDESVWELYPALVEEARGVHTAQWLSVQKFSQDHPKYDYVWNWEMDFRFPGHHYDLLGKLESFAKKQPRKGLWERNERWYIPAYHGDYDTDFRTEIEQRYGETTIWGPPDLSFIKPVGPKPPVNSPALDKYEWGVGEDADMITVSPIFDPIDSNWVIANNVWGYNDSTHEPKDLPRRTTIVTQSRVSKKLLDIMHVENLRGNHVASEMTPQTVALLHGLKAVYAPHPVYMDRDWDGNFLNKWFNPGAKGECGGRGSPMGWGRERRYIGTTWYYRAIPPNRLYNNWMGWSDTGIGGQSWEAKNGRPCLPPVMLHQVKNTEPTGDGHQTTFELAYG